MAKRSKDLTIVIPTLDKNSQVLKECLDSIDKYTTNYTVDVICGETVIDGWNIGIERANTEFIAILNDDVRVTKDWADKMIEAFDNKTGVVGPDVEGLPKPDMEYPHLWFPGSCYLLSQKTIEKVGIFDPSMPIYGGDMDYWIRIIKAGLKIKRVPDVFIYHREAWTVKDVTDGEKMKAEALSSMISEYGFNPMDMFYGSGKINPKIYGT